MKMRSKRWAEAVTRVFLWLLVPAVAAAMQLPPEIQADRHLLEAEKQIQGQNFESAKAAMDRILALEAQHGLQLPAEFFFRYAEVSNRLGLSGTTVDFLTKYLTLAGQEGEHYREALEMLNEAEAEKAASEAAAETERKKAEAAAEAAKRMAEAAKNAIAEMEFVSIPAGEFLMGSDSIGADNDEQPVTRVRISQAFDLGKYEVTQAQWYAVMGSNPSRFDECGPNCPVENVSWYDALEFVGKLNEMEGGGRYRLPTEAEWEYAARAGTPMDRYSENLNGIAWWEGNSGGRPHLVGEKAPNAFGLHDMLGNVREWVGDWYGDYPGGEVTDPRGPASGSERVGRGGSWGNGARHCRASNRFSNSPGYHSSYLGFRLLRTE